MHTVIYGFVYTHNMDLCTLQACKDKVYFDKCNQCPKMIFRSVLLFKVID